MQTQKKLTLRQFLLMGIREKDALVAEKIFPDTTVGMAAIGENGESVLSILGYKDKRDWIPLPAFSTDLAAAMDIVSKFSNTVEINGKSYDISVRIGGGLGEFWCDMFGTCPFYMEVEREYPGLKKVESDYWKSLSLAICVCVLKLVGVLELEPSEE